MKKSKQAKDYEIKDFRSLICGLAKRLTFGKQEQQPETIHDKIELSGF